MWGTRKLLSAVIFTVFYCKVTVQNSKILDMAQNAVDERYIGCRDQAYKKFISDGLLKEELDRNADFRTAWNTQGCQSVSGQSKEHLVALHVSDSDDDFINTFNKAVKKLGADAKTYNEQFHFKSLHFLLMDSMMEQRPQDCKVVYAAVDDYTATKGSMVRFGQFIKAISSFKNLTKIMDLSEIVILNITSCFFAKLDANVCSSEDSVLVSPAEEFTVVDVAYIKNDDSDYQMLILKHSKLFSNHNCYIFSRSTAVSATCWPVLGLAAFAAWSARMF